MRIGSPLDWLRLARVSNLPTTWTNVFVGAAIIAPRPEVNGLVGAAAVTSILYVGGMILNDVLDAPRDAARGLARPIPAGRVDRRLAAGVAIACLLGGPLLALGLAASPVPAMWAAALAACVAGYDLLKERAAASLALMGACRGLIIPLAASLQAGGTAASTGVSGLPVVPVAVVALALAAYVTVVTVIARGEHDDSPPGRDGGEGARRGATWRLLAAPVIAIGVLLVMQPEIGTAASVAGGVGLFVAAAWTRYAAGRLDDDGVVPAAIMRWLAGICLVDAALLGLLGAHWSLPVLAVAAFGLTRRAQRRVAGS